MEDSESEAFWKDYSDINIVVAKVKIVGKIGQVDVSLIEVIVPFSYVTEYLNQEM